MDGFTPIDAAMDRLERLRIMDAINFAMTNEEVEEIRATCEHRYRRMSHECWICGHVKTAEEPAADDVPF
jgi:hypothetical protein